MSDLNFFSTFDLNAGWSAWLPGERAPAKSGAEAHFGSAVSKGKQFRKQIHYGLDLIITTFDQDLLSNGRFLNINQVY